MKHQRWDWFGSNQLELVGGDACGAPRRPAAVADHLREQGSCFAYLEQS